MDQNIIGEKRNDNVVIKYEFIHVWVNVVDVDIVVISMTKKIHSYFIVPKSNWTDMMDKNGL